jgi:hypothetical protein
VFEATCHCGAVRILVDAGLTEVTDCNCSICRRYGVLWFYASLRQVTFASNGKTDTYEWDDRSIKFHRCAACGCVTHWSANDPGRDKMGINARLVAPETLNAAHRRPLDGADSGKYVD